MDMVDSIETSASSIAFRIGGILTFLLLLGVAAASADESRSAGTSDFGSSFTQGVNFNANFNLIYSKILREPAGSGDPSYTAAGVSLRNEGRDTVALTTIPTGRSVLKAFIFWSILAGPSGTDPYAGATP